MQQLGPDDQGRDDEDPRHQIGHRIVDPHDAHEARRGPALLAQPVAIGRDRDRPPDPAGHAEHVDEPAPGDARDQPRHDLAKVRQGQRRGRDHGHEHQQHHDRQDALEQVVAARPDQRHADQPRQDPPGRDPDRRKQRIKRKPRPGHRRRAIDKAPDHDVGAEIPVGPAAEAAPPLEDGPPAGKAEAARALDQDDLHQAPRDHGP